MKNTISSAIANSSSKSSETLTKLIARIKRNIMRQKAHKSGANAIRRLFV